uniref:MerR family DNA-binding transcriptional regulator n=1 Tax=Clostridium sp. NkU-1 TaxID=1095009 RepID=UPI0032613F7C
MIKLTNFNVKKMTIGEMAKINHISEQTLRLYDREGLFSPYTGMRKPDTATMTFAKAPSLI